MSNLFDFLNIEPTLNQTIILEAINKAQAEKKDPQMIQTCRALLLTERGVTTYVYRLQIRTHYLGWEKWFGRKKQYKNGMVVFCQHSLPTWQKILASSLIFMSLLTIWPYICLQ